MLLDDLKAKAAMKDTSKPTTGNESSHEIGNDN
jgi:hypothetical protein